MSPDSKKAVVWVGDSGVRKNLLLNFNNNTGVFTFNTVFGYKSNSNTATDQDTRKGGFSPDSNYYYAGRLVTPYGGTFPTNLVQYPIAGLSSATIPVIVGTNVAEVADLRAGTDDKLYVMSGVSNTVLSRINSPNSTGIACGFTATNIPLAGRRTSVTLPNTFLQSHNLFTLTSPSVSISSNPNPVNICLGQNVTFTATPVNVIGLPVLQWQINGVNVVGQNGLTFSSSTLTNGQFVTCILNDGCVPTISNGITINVAAALTPTFAQVAAICSGQTLAALPLISANGITGSWLPVLNNTATTTYTFTPDAGQCASIATMTITVGNTNTPTFAQVAAICSGQTLAALPLISANGITGSWLPVLNNTATTTYTFTPDAGQCASIATLMVSINPAPTNISISGGKTTCAGLPVNLTITATPGTIINWSGTPSSFTIGATGTNVITVTPTNTFVYTINSASLNGCTIPVANQATTVTISDTPQFITQILDFSICDGVTFDIASLLTSTVAATTYEWSASANNVALPLLSGNETNIDQLVTLIRPFENGSITIAVKPKVGDCYGTEQQIIITVKPVPVINSVKIEGNTAICDLGTIKIDIDANPTGTIFNWQINTANTLNVQIVGGLTNGISTSGNVSLALELINPLVGGTISFDVTPVNGICPGTTKLNVATVTVNPIPGTPIPLQDAAICSGETTNLVISSFPNIPGTMLEWTIIGGANISGANASTIPVLAPVTIADVLTTTSNVQESVIYRVQTILGACKGEFTDYKVFVNPAPQPNLSDGYICVNEATLTTYQSYVLNTQLSNPDFTYDWFVLDVLTNTYLPIAGANAATYNVTTKGTYKVVVTNMVTNCKKEDIAIVNEIFPATGFTYTVTDAFTNNATLTVNVAPQGTGSLIYSLDGGAWQQSNVFTNVQAGEHNILVEDEEGCTKLTEQLTVVDYPKYFTPNRDNHNDFWNIVGLNEQHNAKIYIFDRYGKLIKQINPLGEGWNGIYNGKQAISTDYWFSVEYTENNQQKQFKSHFSLKR